MGDDPNTEWAVYLDYDIEFMNHKIVKVVPLAEADYLAKGIKIRANDPLGAFMKATELLKRVDEGMI